MTQIARFAIYISYDDYLAYYQGTVKNVSVKAHDGRRIEFPAGMLQRHLTREGIRGAFELEFDNNHKLIELRRVG